MHRFKKKDKNRATHAAVIEKSLRPSDRLHVLAVFVLCALGFLIYPNTFHATFHFDDFPVIVNNHAIRNLWDFQTILNAYNTRALTGWAFALNYAFGRLDTFGFHFFNIWLHCNSVLVYAFVLRLLGLAGRPQKNNEILNIWAAFSAALAIEDYNRALDFKPDYGEAHMNRAVALYQLGRFSESQEDLQEARTFGITPHPEFVRKLKKALQERNIVQAP